MFSHIPYRGNFNVINHCGNNFNVRFHGCTKTFKSPVVSFFHACININITPSNSQKRGNHCQNFKKRVPHHHHNRCHQKVHGQNKILNQSNTRSDPKTMQSISPIENSTTNTLKSVENIAFTQHSPLLIDKPLEILEIPSLNGSSQIEANPKREEFYVQAKKLADAMKDFNKIV